MNRSNEYKNYIYSPQWRQKSNYILKITGHKCSLFFWLKATHVHHLHYKNLGNELIIRDCVPLSPKAHKIIHYNIFWNLDGNNKTPSPIRPFLSFYLRLITILLLLLNRFNRNG